MSPRPTERFRRQHDELVQLATTLDGQLAGTLRPDEVQRTLAQLAGKLKMHAAMENDGLYPRLHAHPDPHVRGTARRFVSDFGGAYAQFLAFRARWGTVDAIASAPAEFVVQARQAIALLAERVDHENGELYEMVDRLEAMASRAL